MRGFIVAVGLLMLTGCAGLGEYVGNVASAVSSEPFREHREAISKAAEPLVPNPWSDVVGYGLAAVLAGLGVYKRERWLQQKPSGN